MLKTAKQFVDSAAVVAVVRAIATYLRNHSGAALPAIIANRAIPVPLAVEMCWRNHFGMALPELVATREADGYFAVLFQGAKRGHLEGVDFMLRSNGWEVQNDYIGPFDTVARFQSMLLVRRSCNPL